MKHPILLFSHIPKSGGTSLRKLVTDQYQETEIFRVYGPELSFPPDKAFIEDFKQKQSEFRVVYGHYPYDVHHFLDIPPYYLTVLRQPVARVMSLFASYKRNPRSRWYQQIQEGLTLKDMIRHHLDGGFNNHMTRMISGYQMPDWEKMDDTAYLDYAKSNIEKHYIFTGTTETLQHDIAKLTDLLGWEKAAIPHLNVAKKAHDEVDEETMALILEYNQLDIKLYEWVKKQNRCVRPENLARTYLKRAMANGKVKSPILTFSHIPKSGGAFFQKVIAAQYPEAEICRVYHSELDLSAPNQTFINTFKQNQARYGVVQGHFYYSMHRLLGIPPCYFTILREPVERVLTVFADLKRNTHSDWHQQIQKGLTLQDMIRKCLLVSVNNHMTRMIAGHPEQPGEAVNDAKFLDRAKSNIEKHYVFTGTMETLQRDIAELADLLEWQNVTVPYLNTHLKLHDEIDPETMSLILEHNQLDIKLYEWVKEQGSAIRPENL